MNSKKNKVLMAMSGGVDSSVAAMLLCEQGFEVIGVSMNLFTCNNTKVKSCCSASDRQDARAVCGQLGIKHYVVDYRDRFKKEIIDPFVDEYLSGRTPSPCILCNDLFKFRALFEEADRLGASHVATGHYAKIEKEGKAFKLFKGVDATKDQSYFLFTLKQDVLKRTMFPLGGLTKDYVKKLARDKVLLLRKKPESQEVCFVPDDDYVAFVESQAGGRMAGPGSFVDMKGDSVGSHRGIHAYTIGQRRGLGFGIGKRQYVVELRRERNEVVLGSEDDLLRSEMTVKGVSWVYEECADERRAVVKIRYATPGIDARLEAVDDERVRVVFEEPVRAIAPGQAAVFYRGDEVLGGGWIE